MCPFRQIGAITADTGHCPNTKEVESELRPYVRVSALISRYARFVWLTLARNLNLLVAQIAALAVVLGGEAEPLIWTRWPKLSTIMMRRSGVPVRSMTISGMAAPDPAPRSRAAGHAAGVLPVSASRPELCRPDDRPPHRDRAR
jgi:hypothetical protein